MIFNYKKFIPGLHHGLLYTYYLAAVVPLMLLASCKKSEPVIENKDPDQQRIVAHLDSIYLYSKQIYLWNEQLPEISKFNPGKFYKTSSEELSAYRNEIFELTKFAVNTATGVGYEYNPSHPSVPKYSAIIPVYTSQAKKNDIIQIEEGNSFGVSLYQNEMEVRILYVDANSPAGRSGLKRGDRIIQINDQAASSTTFLELWKRAIQNSFVKLVIGNDDNGTREVRLSATYYEQNPVLKHQVIVSGGKKIGFIAYNSFTDVDNSSRFLEPIFNEFAQKSVTELIIDLRYNGGGYQNTVIYFADKICPAKANGAVMFTEHYNEMMQAGKAEILKHQLLRGSNNEPIYIDGRIASLYDIDYSQKANTVVFNNSGALNNINKIHFIISENTASASELLINVLEPYVDIQLIGVSASASQGIRTYGKPVGFFDIEIGNYALYVPMYQTRNAKGEGDYYDGFAADYSTIDDPTQDFASLDDPAVKLALNPLPAVSNNLSKAGKRKSIPLNGKYILNTDRFQGSRKVAGDFKFKRNVD